MRTGWKYADTYRGWLVTYLVMFAIAQAIELIEPYVIGKVLNAVQANVGAGADAKKLWHDVCFYVGIWFAITPTVWLFHGPGRVIERKVAYHIKANYKRHLVKLLTALPLQWHRDHHSGESIDKINRASNALYAFFDQSFFASYMLFRFLGAQIVLFYFMPSAGGIALASTVITVVLVYLFDRFLYRQYKELNRFENRASAAIQDYVTNIGTVITLRLEGRVLSDVKRRLMAAHSLYMKNVTVHELKWFLSNVLIVGMSCVILIWYVHDQIASHRVILAGTFYTLFEYLHRIGDSFFNFTEVCGTFVGQTADVQGAETIVQSISGEAALVQHNLPEHWKTVNVSGLHFRYEDEEHRLHHLDDVSISLEMGKSIAFTGASGSGKTTLLSLLRGIQSADRVIVSSDGMTLPGQLRHLASTTTLIPQNPELFANTIRFNITFGLDADDADLKRIIEMARFDSVLARLPRGLESNLAEKGLNLSGGEKQRLALARGLFFARDSNIILMDEPTSSVDALNERLIYTSLLDEFADRCIISSVHKLHLLDMFDYVYYFADGRVIEEGKPSVVLASNGPLAQMYASYQLAQTSDVESDLTGGDLD